MKNDIDSELLLSIGAIPYLDNIMEGAHILHLPKHYIEFNHCSNMVDRDWNVHVDNEDFQSIGSANIQTVEQFNQLMNLLDIEFKI